ncbi:MAG: helix-turn-helix domain-containing protein [Muribaculaceae bacterium]
MDSQNQNPTFRVHIMDDFTIMELCSSTLKDTFPKIKRSRTLIFVKAGFLVLKIDNIIATLKENHFADIDTNKRICEIIDCSNDLIGWSFSIHGSAIIRIFDNRPVFDSRYVEFVDSNISVKFQDDFAKLIFDYFSGIELTMRKVYSSRAMTILDLKLRILFLEIATYFETAVLDSVYHGRRNRTSIIFQRLIGFIREYAQTERSVAFYADKLCVSSQYLGRIVNECTGGIVSKLITDAVIVEAKLLLAHEDVTLQEISQRMNFVDQSVFTKYFHRYTGMTPLQYRNSLTTF